MSKINEEGFLELSGVNQIGVSNDALNAQRFPILQGMSPLNLRVLNQYSRIMHVSKGVEMMHAGDTPHDLYFIAEGSIAVAKQHAGKMKVIAQLKAGDVYGEYGALRGKTRFASIYTAQDSKIIRIDLNSFQQVIDADEDFRTRIFKLMKERMLNSFLSGHPVFAGLDQGERMGLSQGLTLIDLPRDELLFEAGSAASDHYMILSGEAEVRVRSEKQEMVVEIRRDNDVLGETRAAKGSKYAYSVCAVNNLDLLLLNQAAMLHIKQLAPSVLPLLAQFMTKQAKKTTVAIQKTRKTS
ncbi:MAG: cyclic nucleotide-binding domain-containing protein [Mariprofundaceae bacterium]|nr:cyclic nucleotide-binding domain-containing protein [Mariprofundaceae bacterium]